VGVQHPVADLPARRFFEQTADPAIFSGGGSVAAMTAAGAASLALLVMQLSERRRTNADRRAEISAAIGRVEQLRDRCFAAADADIACLDRLLIAQRGLKTGGARSVYLTALAAAAASPIELADTAIALLDEIAAQLAPATRFTISDLGAAAVLADGAARAALLTAEVNIALLRDAADSDAALVQDLEQRRSTAYLRARHVADRVEASTRAAIHREKAEA
jgi:formiminotetrahydrofolate cyclodeaminase